ncbi:MAG: hypothetical protein GQ530_02345 [Desulfuromonadales bacterium]|nr:hypothetical protein [Desulfuromonadales bacterium]
MMMLRSGFAVKIIPAAFVFVILMAGAVAVAAEGSVTIRSPDMLALQGRWVRTDAPYMIELRHGQDGALQAVYFNPKPINVGKTETAEQGGLVKILIELQDVNYPGSTYVLGYDRSQDLLQGIYFHPVSKQSYEVTFVRQPTSQ